MLIMNLLKILLHWFLGLVNKILSMMNQNRYEKIFKTFLYMFYFIKIENEDEGDEREGNDDDMINDILTSDEEEEEKEKPIRKTKLVPIDAIDEDDQETLRSLSFNERAKRTIDSSSSSTTRLQHANQIKFKSNDNPRKINDDHRKNVRRAPRGRMNSRRSEP
jgi:hypothetical protein